VKEFFAGGGTAPVYVDVLPLRSKAEFVYIHKWMEESKRNALRWKADQCNWHE